MADRRGDDWKAFQAWELRACRSHDLEPLSIGVRADVQWRWDRMANPTHYVSAIRDVSKAQAVVHAIRAAVAAAQETADQSHLKAMRVDVEAARREKLRAQQSLLEALKGLHLAQKELIDALVRLMEEQQVLDFLDRPSGSRDSLSFSRRLHNAARLAAMDTQFDIDRVVQTLERLGTESTATASPHPQRSSSPTPREQSPEAPLPDEFDDWIDFDSEVEQAEVHNPYVNIPPASGAKSEPVYISSDDESTVPRSDQSDAERPRGSTKLDAIEISSDESSELESEESEEEAHVEGENRFASGDGPYLLDELAYEPEVRFAGRVEPELDNSTRDKSEQNVTDLAKNHIRRSSTLRSSRQRTQPSATSWGSSRNRMRAAASGVTDKTSGRRSSRNRSRLSPVTGLPSARMQKERKRSSPAASKDSLRSLHNRLINGSTAVETSVSAIKGAEQTGLHPVSSELASPTSSADPLPTTLPPDATMGKHATLSRSRSHPPTAPFPSPLVPREQKGSSDRLQATATGSRATGDVDFIVSRYMRNIMFDQPTKGAQQKGAVHQKPTRQDEERRRPNTRAQVKKQEAAAMQANGNEIATGAGNPGQPGSDDSDSDGDSKNHRNGKGDKKSGSPKRKRRDSNDSSEATDLDASKGEDREDQHSQSRCSANQREEMELQGTGRNHASGRGSAIRRRAAAAPTADPGGSSGSSDSGSSGKRRNKDEREGRRPRKRQARKRSDSSDAGHSKSGRSSTTSASGAERSRQARGEQGDDRSKDVTPDSSDSEPLMSSSELRALIERETYPLLSEYFYAFLKVDPSVDWLVMQVLSEIVDLWGFEHNWNDEKPLQDYFAEEVARNRLPRPDASVTAGQYFVAGLQAGLSWDNAFKAMEHLQGIRRPDHDWTNECPLTFYVGVYTRLMSILQGPPEGLARAYYVNGVQDGVREGEAQLVMFDLLAKYGDNHDWMNELRLRDHVKERAVRDSEGNLRIVTRPLTPTRPERRQNAPQLQFGEPWGSAGHWNYIEPIGVGAYGIASLWRKYDQYGKIIDRVVTKESYLSSRSWSIDMYWWDHETPQEVWVAKRLTDLAKDQSCGSIMQLRAWRLYREMRMWRMYVEYLAGGDLENFIRRQAGAAPRVDQYGTDLDL